MECGIGDMHAHAHMHLPTIGRLGVREVKMDGSLPGPGTGNDAAEQMIRVLTLSASELSVRGRKRGIGLGVNKLS